MTTVTIYGSLASRLKGEVWRFEVSSVREVFDALEATTGELVRTLLANPENAYHISVNGSPVTDYRQLVANHGELKTVTITPVIQGSGNMGGWLAIIGLVILAIVIPGAMPALTSASISLTTGQAFFITLGLTLTLSGVSQMLIGSAKSDSREAPENKPSYIFSGPVNTLSQGNPIPLGFGEVLIGSQVISAGIRTVDIPSDKDDE